MLRELELEHFKCFELLHLPLKSITLLTGTNASGKSSILQALALMSQTMRDSEWSRRLVLNGSAVKLGTVGDVVDKAHGRRSVRLGLMDESNQYRWHFSGDRSEMSMTVDLVEIDGRRHTDFKGLRYLLPMDEAFDDRPISIALRQLTYLTAERLGPRDFYALADSVGEAVIGPAGERALSLLHSGRDSRVLSALELDGIPATRLRQVEGYMQLFFPGCSLQVVQVPNTNAVTLGLRTSSDTDFHRPVNVGFGLTQVLPILVAVLSARAGDLVLIENPEVHLHPAGQSLMGEVLARAGSAGIQVIAETHSDHVLNGVRRAVKGQSIAAKDVCIHFFCPRDGNTPQVTSPQVSSDGRLDHWPPGFFDQIDKDSSYFAGWGSEE